MEAKKYLTSNIYLILLCVLAAGICHMVFVHVAFGIFKDWPGWHAAHINGSAPSPLQFRWLSFFIPELLIKTGLGTASAYLLLRFVGLALGFWFSALIVRQLATQALAPALMVLALALYYAASTQSHFQPSEEPNLFFFSLFIWLVLRGSGIFWLSVVLLFGVLNKDTVGFLIPFVFLYRWLGEKKHSAAITESGILAVVFLAGYVGLRWYFGTGRPYLGGLWQLEYNVHYIFDHPASGLMWLLPSFLPMAHMLSRWRLVPMAIRCFLPPMILFVIGHLLISRVDEFRTYTPLALLMWPGILAMMDKPRDGA